MVTFRQIKKRPSVFKSFSGLSLAAVEELLPSFYPAYEDDLDSHDRQHSPARQRARGGGFTTTTNRKPTFDWNDPAGATGYTIQISKNATFTSLVGTYNITASTYTPTANLPVGTLYWRVRAKGPNGPSDWSAAWSIVITP
jgi:hypothetical protein